MVLDASVAAKWFFAEDQADPSLRLAYSQTHLHVPELFVSEFSSILLKQIRRSALDGSEASWMFEAVIGRVIVSGAVPAGAHALEIAMMAGISAYDAIYVALAEAMGIRFVTADERLVRAMEVTPYSELVILVSGFILEVPATRLEGDS